MVLFSPPGFYWIDPNEGCISDAEYVYCDFENNRACVHPKKENVSLLCTPLHLQLPQMPLLLCCFKSTLFMFSTKNFTLTSGFAEEDVPL